MAASLFRLVDLTSHFEVVIRRILKTNKEGRNWDQVVAKGYQPQIEH